MQRQHVLQTLGSCVQAVGLCLLFWSPRNKHLGQGPRLGLGLPVTAVEDKPVHPTLILACPALHVGSYEPEVPKAPIQVGGLKLSRHLQSEFHPRTQNGASEVLAWTLKLIPVFHATTSVYAVLEVRSGEA